MNMTRFDKGIIKLQIDYTCGDTSFVYQLEKYGGSVAFDNRNTTISLESDKRIYIISLDVTPDKSKAHAEYYALMMFNAYRKVKSGHKSMLKVVEIMQGYGYKVNHFYSSDKAYGKHNVEYYNGKY